eukprot:gene14566-19555_t
MENLSISHLDVYLPQEIHVNDSTDENDTPIITISYVKNGRVCIMIRPVNELMFNSLNRLRLNIIGKLNKPANKTKNKTRKIINDVSHPSMYDKCRTDIKLAYNMELIDIYQLTNNEFASEMILNIDTNQFVIMRNMPIIQTVSTNPSNSIIETHPVVANIYSSFASKVEYYWFVEKAPKMDDYDLITMNNSGIFHPPCMKEGCRMKLYCIPYHHNMVSDTLLRGRAVVHYVSGHIHALPIDCFNQMIITRNEFINHQQSNSNELRLISYNILAEPFATSDNSINNIYSYVKPDYLQTDYRVPRIYAELQSYDADIICLQECDSKTYELYLNRLFSSFSLHNTDSDKIYSGHFTNKSSSVLEGCAMFINSNKLVVQQYLDIPIKSLLQSSSTLEPFYLLRPDLREVLEAKLGTIVQLSICRKIDSKNDIVIIANTHLFYHPYAGLIRLIQTDAIIKLITLIKNELLSHGSSKLIKINGDENFENYFNNSNNNNNKVDGTDIAVDISSLSLSPMNMNDSIKHCSHQNDENVSVSVIFAGDLNCSPHLATVSYLSRGYVDEEQFLHDWNDLNSFGWGASPSDSLSNKSSIHIKKSKFTEDDLYQLIPIFRHSLSLISAAEYPRYSNYVRDFKSLLDYIFIDESKMLIKRIAPFPDESILSQNTALPSAVFPSDHMSIAVDISFIDTTTHKK